MATTLANALNNFNTEYLNALASKSKRKIDQYDQDWQQINNYWDVYFQASAEGLTTMANSAIDGIVAILGGVIDTSLLPVVTGGAVPTIAGVESVTPTLQKITMPRNVGSTDYSLVVNILNSEGYSVGYKMGAKENDGFYITPSLAGTLTYQVIIL